MKQGVTIAAAGVCDAQTCAELARLAEEANWDGIFLEDYITHWSASDVPTYDPWVTLAAMAMRTERIHLGTQVTPLPRRRPWKLAREAVTIDHLSNGRFILGVGAGGVSDSQNFDQLGEAPSIRRRAEMLDEALDILVGLWSGEPFSYHGKHYHVDNVTFLPTPVQKPRIPIWIGGCWPNKGPTERAARWDGSCLYKETHGGPWQDMVADDVRALKKLVESRQATPQPYDIAVGGRARAADWNQERAHIRSVAEAGATWWIEYVAPAELDVMRECIRQGPLHFD